MGYIRSDMNITIGIAPMVPGWTSIMISIIVVSFFQLIALMKAGFDAVAVQMPTFELPGRHQQATS
jgi:hypothetical protein